MLLNYTNSPDIKCLNPFTLVLNFLSKEECEKIIDYIDHNKLKNLKVLFVFLWYQTYCTMVKHCLKVKSIYLERTSCTIVKTLNTQKYKNNYLLNCTKNKKDPDWNYEHNFSIFSSMKSSLFSIC